MSSCGSASAAKRARTCSDATTSATSDAGSDADYSGSAIDVSDAGSVDSAGDYSSLPDTGTLSLRRGVTSQSYGYDYDYDEDEPPDGPAGGAQEAKEADGGLALKAVFGDEAREVAVDHGFKWGIADRRRFDCPYAEVVAACFELLETTLGSELGIAPWAAGALLMATGYNAKDVVDKYTSTETGLRESLVSAAGLPFPVPKRRDESAFAPVGGDEAMECPTCFDDVAGRDLFAMRCGHAQCRDCWQQACHASLEDGTHACLRAQCPAGECSLIIPGLVWQLMASPDDYAAYKKRKANFATWRCANTAWCPGRSCTRVYVVADSSVIDVQCPCGFLACWACCKRPPGDRLSQVAHQPATCRQAQRWEEYKATMSSVDPEALAVQATRHCPHCRFGPISRSKGCECMTCPEAFGGCGKEFCFQCGKDWKKYHVDHFECRVPAKDLDGSAAATKDAEDKLRTIAPFKRRYAFVQGLHDSARGAREPIWEDIDWAPVRARFELVCADAGRRDYEIDRLMAEVQEVSNTVALCRDASAWSQVALVFLPDLAAASHTKAALFESQQVSLQKLTAWLQHDLEINLPEMLRRDSVSYPEIKRFLDELQERATEVREWRIRLGSDIRGIDERVERRPPALQDDDELPDNWRCGVCTFMNMDRPRETTCGACNNPREDLPPLLRRQAEAADAAAAVAAAAESDT